MDDKKIRTLIIIGGGEDKEDSKTVLREVARHVQKGRLLVSPVTSHEPEGYFEPYRAAFEELGLADVQELDIRSRREANDSE